MTGSRFGRSESSFKPVSDMAPRVDRFFYGSRYGKRSSTSAIATSDIGESSVIDLQQLETVVNLLQRIKQTVSNHNREAQRTYEHSTATRPYI